MDRKTLLAMALSFLIIFGWQKLYLEPRLPRNNTQIAQINHQQQSQPNQAQSTTPPNGASLSQASKPTSAPKAKQELPLEVSTGAAKISNGPKLFADWNLKSYKLSLPTQTAKQAAAVDLKSVIEEDGVVELSFDSPEYAYLGTESGNLTGTAQNALWSVDDSKISLKKEISSSPQRAWVDLKISAQFKSAPPKFAFVSITAASTEKNRDNKLVYFTKDSLDSSQLFDIEKLVQVPTPVKWIGANTRYFLFTLVSADPQLQPIGLVQPVSLHTGRVSLVYPVSGNSISIPLRAYFGPKELNVLRTVDKTLDHSVDFGWFTLFAFPILKIMKWLYAMVHNYGVAIILLTAMIKLLTFPLTYKSMKSMRQMSKIQPQLQKIREKYKDDRESLNRETLALMRTNGYNPMAGCLPMVIQMPIFFALYRVLYSSIELYQAPFAFWIHDLSYKDPLYVTPVLLAVTMFVQQKLTPNTATDPTQQKMMQFMPLMFGFFMITLPAGLTLYMLVNAVMSIIQQIFLNKKLGLQGQSFAKSTR
jgi:YidC/Oxa1 family membrane protein insertase